MRLRLILFLLFTVSVLYVKADQQAVLSKEDAEKTVAFLKTQDEIVLFCGCCSNDNPTRVILSDVTYECKYIDWCYVSVTGINAETQTEVSKSLDLAYTWINADGIAQNLAWEMGLNADPCAPKFDWETFEMVEDVQEPSFNKKDAKIFQSSFKKLKNLLESETGFTLEAVGSKKEFIVEKVTLTLGPIVNSIVVSYVGGEIEQRYTIPLDRIEALEKNTEGIEFDTMEDGVVMAEEFVNSENQVRRFYYIHTVPIHKVDMLHLKHFELLIQTHASM